MLWPQEAVVRRGEAEFLQQARGTTKLTVPMLQFFILYMDQSMNNSPVTEVNSSPTLSVNGQQMFCYERLPFVTKPME